MINKYLDINGYKYTNQFNILSKNYQIYIIYKNNQFSKVLIYKGLQHLKIPEIMTKLLFGVDIKIY